MSRVAEFVKIRIPRRSAFPKPILASRRTATTRGSLAETDDISLGSPRKLPADFQVVFNALDALDAAHRFLGHLLLIVRVDNPL
jgi:hypothetical protein